MRFFGPAEPEREVVNLIDALKRSVARSGALLLATLPLAGEVNVNVRDLFERFLPPGERAKRLGDDFKPEAILALALGSSRACV